jgi:hypothetical protein
MLRAYGDFMHCYLVEEEPAIAVVGGVETHDIEG